jgi:phytol kinase
MLSWLLPLLFSSPLPFIIVCAIFAVLLTFDTRYHFVKAMASADDGNWGTVYFPIAAGTVAWLFWETPPVMVAAIMPLTWGDGMAEVIGRKFGRNRYTVFGHTRTLEGSAAFLVFGTVATWLALTVVPGAPDLSPTVALAPAVTAVAAATLIEALSIRGLDNLTITAVVIAVFTLWPL